MILLCSGVCFVRGKKDKAKISIRIHNINFGRENIENMGIRRVPREL
jgi:hypothetical protein